MDDKFNHVVYKKMLSDAFGFRVFQESDISWVYLYNSDTLFSFSHDRYSYCTDVVLVNCSIGDEEAEILSNALNSKYLEETCS